VRDVVRNSMPMGGFSSLNRYITIGRGGPPAAAPGDQEDRRVPVADHDLPFSACNVPRLAEFLVVEGVAPTPVTKACRSCPARKASSFGAETGYPKTPIRYYQPTG
jgi:hypothetical protein